MTYARTLLPKFYPDVINWLKLNGQSKSDTLTDRTGTYNTGYDKFDLFDLNPQNIVSFNSAESAVHVMIQIDLGAYANDIDYAALLNHNLDTSEYTIRIAHSSTTITGVGLGITVGTPMVILNGEAQPSPGATVNEAMTDIETGMDVSDGTKFTAQELIKVLGDNGNEVMKVTGIATNTLTVIRAQQGTTATTFAIGDQIERYNCVTPTADGDTIFSFTSSSDRYWAIELIPSDGLSSLTDLTMGSLSLGEMFSLPHSPDMNVVHNFNMSGVNISTGLSGKRHSSPNWIKANNTAVGAGNYIPFRGSTGATQLPGREGYSLSYSALADTELLPSDLGAPSGNNVAVNVLAKTGWNALPFIMSVDSESTTAGDYIFCRMRENTYSITQTSAKAYSTAFGVEQEF